MLNFNKGEKMEVTQTKTCETCKKTKEISAFGYNRHGYFKDCKKCVGKRRKMIAKIKREAREAANQNNQPVINLNTGTSRKVASVLKLTKVSIYECPHCGGAVEL